MKKILMILCTLTVALSMSTNVFASEEVTKAAWQDKRSDVVAFRESVKEHRDVVKANREENKALIQENTVLRKNLAEKLRALKDSGIALDEEIAAELEALRAEMKSITAELKATKGDIKEIADEKKESIKALDYEAMDAAFVSIGEIQADRNAKLTRINEILKEMIALIS